MRLDTRTQDRNMNGYSWRVRVSTATASSKTLNTTKYCSRRRNKVRAFTVQHLLVFEKEDLVSCVQLWHVEFIFGSFICLQISESFFPVSNPLKWIYFPQEKRSAITATSSSIPLFYNLVFQNFIQLQFFCTCVEAALRCQVPWTISMNHYSIQTLVSSLPFHSKLKDKLSTQKQLPSTSRTNTYNNLSACR